MIRLVQFDDEEKYKDFHDQLFSAPYGFVFDFKNDKVTISNITYRLSSLIRLPQKDACMCMCGGGKTDLETDISLQGIGTLKLPLGVQVSKKEGNQLEILEDGCYVHGYVPYIAPKIKLSGSLAPGNYLLGEKFYDVTLTIQIEKGSDNIQEVKLYQDSEEFHVFADVSPDSKTYTLKLDEPIKNGLSFKAKCKDESGKETASNTLVYTFDLPVYAGVADSTDISSDEISKNGEVLNISSASFDHVYKEFTNQHIWLACNSNRKITQITDENGFNITASFIQKSIKIKLDEEYDYILYIFDIPTTGKNYTVTFNS